MDDVTDKWLKEAQVEKLAIPTETKNITSNMPEEAQVEKLAIPTETKNIGSEEARKELSTTIAETETLPHEDPATPTRTKRAKEHVKTLAHRAMSMMSMRSSSQHDKRSAKPGDSQDEKQSAKMGGLQAMEAGVQFEPKVKVPARASSLATGPSAGDGKASGLVGRMRVASSEVQKLADRTKSLMKK
ncbi:hypothetical protein HYQ45_014933 [Verticillium longisporum]|uniref:Uncharacterized protein n=1 Tax=Verticillium longisporum TaxID=100787 RepID=A0A8I2ZBM8_VERLO|nr:hypothetical protein HYQ44_005560 [Verticillium longisporum]KAG7119614.1 hypothetical protein HYQ45_014933 [Verticillium longisporum]